MTSRRCSGFEVRPGHLGPSAFVCVAQATYSTRFADGKKERLLCAACVAQAKNKLGDRLLVTRLDANTDPRRVPGFVRRLQSWVKSLAHVFAKP